MFTQSCFIRKNTPELRKKLIQIGRKLNHGKVWGKNLICFRSKDTNEDLFVASPDADLHNAPEFKNMIDCETNENLFLALAALRDDTDINQWFICQNDYREWDEWDAIGKFDVDRKKGEIAFNDTYENVQREDYFGKNWRKMTPKELIKHFKIE